MYENGKGVTRDYVRALEWYRPAANKGYAAAQLNVGFYYAEGYGTARDDEQAFAWFRKAANQGNATAQYDLGYAYESGRGVKPDVVEAKQWYRRAASQGHKDALARLMALQSAQPLGGMISFLKRAIGIASQ